MLLTRLPLYLPAEAGFRVRLACVRRAASVDSEPGSNSRLNLRHLAPIQPPPLRASTLQAGIAFTIPERPGYIVEFSFRLKLGIVYNELHVQPDYQRTLALKIHSRFRSDPGKPETLLAEIPSAAGLKTRFGDKLPSCELTSPAHRAPNCRVVKNQANQKSGKPKMRWWKTPLRPVCPT